MVTLPDADWRRRPGLGELVAVLGGGDNVRLVGGAVRDGLLDLPVSDIDMATRLTPDDVVARLTAAGIKAVPTGIAHGTVTAVSNGHPVEVTTLRRDVATDGRHATVVFSNDWREDAARRDFTINALYADWASGEVFDWFGGLNDLEARRVRFIGDPLTRIAEDHLRILRFFRFHARFGVGAPDSEGLAACAARANDLMALSRERIAMELLKLLDGPDPAPVVALMIDHGILAPVLPEIADTAALARLVVRESASDIAGEPVRRLAALVGPDPQLAATIAARLKLSNARTNQLVVAATREEAAPETLAYRHGINSAVDLLLLGDGTSDQLHSLADWQRPSFGLTGGQLIARGLTPGPIVAITLRRIEAAWVEAGFPTGDEREQITDEAMATAFKEER